MNDSTRQLVEGVGVDAESTRGDPYPPGVQPRRAQKSVVLSVRLSESEHAQLVSAAGEAELGPSTLVRSLVQDYLTRSVGTGGVAEAVHVSAAADREEFAASLRLLGERIRKRGVM